jgi:SAM-dependent methyltransferase
MADQPAKDEAFPVRLPVRRRVNPIFFDAYRGRPPWDIGRAQPAFVELANEGLVEGSVLDLGCGTGDCVLEMAERGHEAWGIDIVPAAIDQAEAKRRLRGLEAMTRFLVGDALDLATVGRTFDTVVDCGLYHTFSDPERELYEQNLQAVTHAGSRVHIMALSDWEEDWGGPRRVSQAELLDTFRSGWRCDDIREARFVSNFPAIRGHAWLATFVREATSPRRAEPARRRNAPVAKAPMAPAAVAAPT